MFGSGSCGAGCSTTAVGAGVAGVTRGCTAAGLAGVATGRGVAGAIGSLPTGAFAGNLLSAEGCAVDCCAAGVLFSLHEVNVTSAALGTSRERSRVVDRAR